MAGQQQGLFWLPSNPNLRVNGIFSAHGTHNGVARLSLLGPVSQSDPLAALDHLLNSSSRDEQEQDVIHGVLNDAECDKATLLNCVLISDPGIVFEASMWEADWLCHASFRGSNYLDKVPDQIKNLEIGIQGLGDWIPNDWISVEDWRSLFQSPTVLPSSPPDMDAPWSLGTVAVHRAMRIRNLNTDERSIEHHASFLITYDHPQPWCVALDTAESLQTLVSVATGEAVNVECLRIEEGPSNGQLDATFVPVLYASEDPTPPHSNLFTLKELGGATGVASWLNAVQENRLLRRYLLIDRYRLPTLITDTYSHLLHGCEAYLQHEEKRPGEYLSPSSVRHHLRAKAPRAFKEWVDLPGWTNKLQAIRDQEVAHLQTPSTTTDEIVAANERLYLWLITRLLSDCGGPEDLLTKVIQRWCSPARVHL